MTGSVAPHEGHEIDLVISGDKPLAVIEKRKQPEQYRRAKLYTRFPQGLKRRIRKGADGWEAVVSRAWFLMDHYEQLLDVGVERLGIKGYHRAMGCLFGYSPADIEAFIDAEIDCDCSKCGGAMRQLQDDKRNRFAADCDARRTQAYYQ